MSDTNSPVKTCVNVVRLFVLPVPNCPLLLFPVAKSLPSVVIANEELKDITTLDTDTPVSTGVNVVRLTVLPLPNWP